MTLTAEIARRCRVIGITISDAIMTIVVGYENWCRVVRNMSAPQAIIADRSADEHKICTTPHVVTSRSDSTAGQGEGRKATGLSE